MSLTVDRVAKNTQKYFKTASDNGFMNETLANSLGQDFIKAPASHLKILNNAFEGGLIDHLLNVTKFAVNINNTLPEEMKAEHKSLLKVCFLHQIGKAKMYVPCTSEWHQKNLGKMYDFNEEDVSMRVGERSIFLATSAGITFTDEEYIAILNFDKSDDKMAEYHNSLLGDILKAASILAIKYEKMKSDE